VQHDEYQRDPTSAYEVPEGCAESLREQGERHWSDHAEQDYEPTSGRATPIACATKALWMAMAAVERSAAASAT
jgi:hypothetical protein